VITGRLLAGAFLVAALALVLDLILATIQRFGTSRGITRRYRKSHLPGPADSAVSTPDAVESFVESQEGHAPPIPSAGSR